MEKVVAIVLAAGSGRRMAQGVNKPFLEIGGQTVLERAIRAFERAKRVTEIIVVIKKAEVHRAQALIERCGFEKIRCVVEGGVKRQSSVYAGLQRTTADDAWILVHDGARPFITGDMIDDMVCALISKNESDIAPKNALILAVPSKDTIKQVEGGCVKATLDRSVLWNVQTPQGFDRRLLVEAHERAKIQGFTGTDDAALVERLGHSVYVRMGSYDNIKITTPEDLYFGDMILKKRGAL